MTALRGRKQLFRSLTRQAFSDAIPGIMPRFAFIPGLIPGMNQA